MGTIFSGGKKKTRHGNMKRNFGGNRVTYCSWQLWCVKVARKKSCQTTAFPRHSWFMHFLLQYIKWRAAVIKAGLKDDAIVHRWWLTVLTMLSWCSVPSVSIAENSKRARGFFSKLAVSQPGKREKVEQHRTSSTRRLDSFVRHIQWV